MFLKILLFILVLLAGFAIFVAFRPADFRITRSARIAASPARISSEIADLHRWSAWSPWAELDPRMKLEFSGPASGTGASYQWSGNQKVGSGRMTITDYEPGKHVRLKLEFLTPFAATNTGEFTFEPAGDATLVTWSMSGRNNFLARAFTVFVNMDRLVGSQFEQGLAKLRTIVETPASH